MNEKENIINYPNNIETRVYLLDSSVSNINQTLMRLENKIDTGFNDVRREMMRIENKMDKGFDEVRGELKEIRKENRSDFQGIRKDMKVDFRLLIGALAGLAGIMAHGFHWF
jgi:hypothetical protein